MCDKIKNSQYIWTHYRERFTELNLMYCKIKAVIVTVVTRYKKYEIKDF